MLARFRAPMLFFLLGTPIADLPLYLFRLNSHVISVLPYFVPMMYVGGFIFSVGTGILFSTLGAMFRRFTGQPVSLWLGAVLGAFSGAFVAYLTFRGRWVPLEQPILWGGIAGLICGWLYTYQCDGRFVPIWGDAALREVEDAKAATAAAKLTEFMRLKTDGKLDGQHSQCPSCNAFIAQDSTECPSCQVNLRRNRGQIPIKLR